MLKLILRADMYTEGEYLDNHPADATDEELDELDLIDRLPVRVNNNTGV